MPAIIKEHMLTDPWDLSSPDLIKGFVCISTSPNMCSTFFNQVTSRLYSTDFSSKSQKALLKSCNMADITLYCLQNMAFHLENTLGYEHSDNSSSWCLHSCLRGIISVLVTGASSKDQGIHFSGLQ